MDRPPKESGLNHESAKLAASSSTRVDGIEHITSGQQELHALEEEIECNHRQVGWLMASSLVFALRTGEALLKVKALLPRRYLAWIDEVLTPRCGISRRTAQRYTQLARRKQDLLTKLVPPDQIGNLNEDDAHRLLVDLSIEDAQCLLNLEQKPCNAPISIDILTPREIIDRAVRCLGEIDLDPCAESVTPHNVPAHIHYTAEVDGLDPSVSWHGSVFIHPPHEHPVRWIRRAVEEYDSPARTEILLLLKPKWLCQCQSTLDRFPRIYLSDPLKCSNAVADRPGRKSSSFQGIIVGMLKPCRYHALHDSFADMGTLFIPYRPSEQELFDDQ